MDHSANPLPGFADAAAYEAARRRLHEADYTPAGIASALGRTGVLAVEAADLPLNLHRTRSGSPRDTLIRLFLLEQPVTEEAAGEALAAESVDSWIEAGLLARDAVGIVSRVKLLPYENLYFASDRISAIRSGTRPDFVMSVGHATELLWFAAVPARGGATLDIGCGCGGLGLLAAAGSSQVLLTDITPRSIGFTEFNARLNGITNVSAAAGDMFAPAENRTFDRILCNPPFVISPRARYIFRDSGRRGDEFCRELVRAAPALLNDGGYFQLTANLPHVAGTDWRGDWQAWFHGLGCDAIVWANETVEIEEYTTNWLRDTEASEAADVERFDDWIRYFELQQIEAVTYGVIILRKRSGDNYVLIDDTARKIVGPCGGDVERAFLLEDFWRRFPSDSGMLDQTFAVSSQARLVETRAPDVTGKLKGSSTKIMFRGGVRNETELDPAGLALIEKCDGSSSLREIIPSIAARFNVAEENLSAALPAVVVQLARRGYLDPVGLGGGS